MTREELVSKLEGGETGFYIDIAISNMLFNPCPDDLRLLCVRAGGGSLDAALALVERVKPGWRPGVIKLNDKWEGSLISGEGRFLIDGDKEFYGSAPTPAAALIAALLKAEG